MNKIVIGIVILAGIIVGGYFLFNATKPAPVSGPAVTPPAVKVNSGLPAATPSQNTVIYSEAGYSPAMLTIKKGETVFWKNESSQAMWTASAYHPSHTVYSGTSLAAHCPDTAGTAFDACTGIQPGKTWSFTFTKIGTWYYHDHLSPEYTGTIIVGE